ncbi:hypothetical protein CDD81_2069 [Ophiocordyceps australis]|uniref:AB hydrolase-1 domain-containing protein n=1 Tax=Ophiocordyceps australis TaxID=1399860 RepID=A0A2C5XZV4_9HYPO|nr:hypothetical protein CDD81_2069 [Ophiocordyceps australis]
MEANSAVSGSSSEATRQDDQQHHYSQQQQQQHHHYSQHQHQHQQQQHQQHQHQQHQHQQHQHQQHQHQHQHSSSPSRRAASSGRGGAGIPPASPEVISSLITSLSGAPPLSPPPAASAAKASGVRQSASDSFGMGSDLTYLDHFAASSPIVRTAPSTLLSTLPRSATHDDGGLGSLLDWPSRPCSRDSLGPDGHGGGLSDKTMFLVDGSPSSVDYTGRAHRSDDDEAAAASPDGHRGSSTAAASPKPIPDRDSSLGKRSKPKAKARSRRREAVSDVIAEHQGPETRVAAQRTSGAMAERSFYLGIDDEPSPRSHLALDSDDNADDDFCAPYPSVSNGRWRDKHNHHHHKLSSPALKLKPSSSRLARRSAPGPASPRSDSPITLGATTCTTTAADAPPRASTSAIERPSSADSIDNDVDACLASPRLSQKVCHAQTGRVISFSEVGDPNGSAVFCCVGMGLTRFVMAFYDELAQTLKLRLITPDRPGVGESEAYSDGTTTPLSWPDDVYAICQSLKISKFSILAHSAGAIYALATALRMPQHIRGRIHLLAPWIPPSQMNVFGSQTTPPTNAIPTSQKILRALPTPILKAANSSFMTATSSSITSSLPKNQRRSKRKTVPTPAPLDVDATAALTLADLRSDEAAANMSNDAAAAAAAATAATTDEAQLARAHTSPGSPNNHLAAQASARRRAYDARLTNAIWDRATKNANPAVDLLVCLERRHAIGFRYVDITRPVVIHHGSRDSRVPVDNVRWLGKAMRRCEVRVLEGEGHGLMASASVMGSVLMEVSREWEDWMRATGQREKRKSIVGRAV